jgi:hypothetical protein
MIERYKAKKISEITRRDSKVMLIGEIVSKGKNSFVLRDDTGEVEIFWDEEIKGKFARAFCSVVNDKLKADIVHELSEKEFYLFKKFNELYSKVEEYV